MSEEHNSPISRVSWSKTIAVVMIVVAVFLIVIYLVEKNKDFELQIDKAGKATIKVNPDDSFVEVFKKALDEDVSLVNAILASRQYYKFGSAELVDQLERLDPSQPDSQEFSNRLRRMLWDLRGPFGLPGTLRGADKRIVAALDDLETALKDAKKASALLAELWELSLDRAGIFKPRFFEATVEVVQRAPTGSRKYEIALACPGSVLVSGRVMHLYTNHGSIWAEVIQDPSLFDCSGSALTAERLLTGETARLGLSETAFRQLVDPAGESGTGHGKSYAKFELLPRDLGYDYSTSG